MVKLHSNIQRIITAFVCGKSSFSRKIKLLFICSFLMPTLVFSFDFPPERSESAADKEIGWLVAPLPIVVEGIGSGVPIAASISNVYKNSDFLFISS